MTKQLATIEKVEVFIEDHGLLTSFLTLSLGSSATQGFGGFALGRSLNGDNPYLEWWKKRCCDIVGVTDFKNLCGKQINIFGNMSHIEYIESLDGKRQFNPYIEMKDVKLEFNDTFNTEEYELF
jgi:hypothetical protein